MEGPIEVFLHMSSYIQCPIGMCFIYLKVFIS